MPVNVTLETVDQAVFDAYMERLPSLTPEQTVEQTKRLGHAPLCKENFADRLFAFGLRAFNEDLAQPALTLANATIKAEAFKEVQSLIQVVIDLNTSETAKLKQLQSHHGKDVKGLDGILAMFEKVIKEEDSKKRLEILNGDIPKAYAISRAMSTQETKVATLAMVLAHLMIGKKSDPKKEKKNRRKKK